MRISQKFLGEQALLLSNERINHRVDLFVKVYFIFISKVKDNYAHTENSCETTERLQMVPTSKIVSPVSHSKFMNAFNCSTLL